MTYKFYQYHDIVITKLKDGFTHPLIQDIQNNHYDFIWLSLNSPFGSALKLSQQNIENISYAIGQCPTLTGLAIDHITATQAAFLLNHTNYLNTLSIDSILFAAEGLKEFSTAIKHSEITELTIGNANLNVTKINELDFSHSKIESLHLDNNNINFMGFSKLIDKLSGTDVKMLDLNYNKIGLGPMSQVDLAKTNIESLSLFGNELTDASIEKIILKDSQVQYLSIGNNNITDIGLTCLSHNLKGSHVESLSLYLNKYQEKSLANLCLHGTSVKELFLENSDITDNMINYLNLKGTNVESIDLSFNLITHKGEQALMDMISGTKVKEVTLNYFLNDQFIEHVLVNKNVDLHKSLELTEHSAPGVALKFQDIISDDPQAPSSNPSSHQALLLNPIQQPSIGAIEQHLEVLI